MTTDLEAILGGHPFFYGMREKQLATLASVATPAKFAVGERIIKQGEVADACYLLVEGDAALEIVIPGKGPQVIQTLHAGDILGWSWLFSPYEWSFDAQALTPLRAIRFDAPTLREAKAADPELNAELMERFAEVLVTRLQAARLQLMDLYGNPR
jgi:CRP-like cAMP-binding protein